MTKVTIEATREDADTLVAFAFSRNQGDGFILAARIANAIREQTQPAWTTKTYPSITSGTATYLFRNGTEVGVLYDIGYTYACVIETALNDFDNQNEEK